jgi:hypothetical protein
MISKFEEILVELGKIFQLPLHIDHFHACTLQVHETMKIQLQLDMSQENLWIFSKLIEVPPGKFRENVFREALKANALPDPRIAILGYLSTTNHLALFQKYPLAILDGERLSGLIGSFLEMGQSWIQAITAGQPAPRSLSTPSNPFGLK